MRRQPARRSASVKRTGAPGDWMSKSESRLKAASAEMFFDVPDVDKDIYGPLENPKMSPVDEVMQQVAKGKAVRGSLDRSQSDPQSAGGRPW